MTDSYPIDQSPQMHQAAEIAQLANTQGLTGLMVNPITGTATAVNGQISALGSQVDTAIAGVVVNNPAYARLTQLRASLGGLNAQVSRLNSHANSLVFGDGQGRIIRGGLQSNANQALSRIRLDNTLGQVGGTPTGSPSNPCALIEKFLGTILGAGAALLAAAQQVLAQVQAVINQVLAAIQQGLAIITAMIDQAIAQVEAMIRQIADQIAQELAQYAQWLAAQINYAIGAFFAGFHLDPCMARVMSAVATPALSGILNG